MNRLPLIALIAFFCLVAAGCGGGEGGGEASEPEPEPETQPATVAGCRSVDAPEPEERTAPRPTKRLDPAKRYDLTFRTNCGTFAIRLDVQGAPATAASLVSLARRGYFDETIFHRIVPGFVIQGGDPSASGSGGPGYKTVDRPRPDARYTHGVVAMAKTQTEPPGTSGSQFFVVTGTDVGLPPEYAVVGRVVKELAVVDRIGALGDANEQPTQTVEIEKATVSVS
jgi:cyclophilin family peptidyl-prolyl cis-trans isomerase